MTTEVTVTVVGIQMPQSSGLALLVKSTVVLTMTCPYLSKVSSGALCMAASQLGRLVQG